MLSALIKSLRYNKYHLLAFGFVAILAHPIFWTWWTYIYPNQYESVPLRSIGALSCIFLLFMTFQEEKYKNFLKIYWLFVVIYNLPFFFTVNLIKNELIDVWLMEEIVMIFVVILFIPSIIMALFALLVGVSSAVVFCIMTNTPQIYPLDALGAHSLQYALALVAGYIFNYSNVMGVKAMERHKVLQSLGGSIAHEMRNPLGSIQQSAHLLLDKLKQVPKVKKTNRLVVDRREVEEVSDLLKIINRSSVRGNMIIDMILSNIHGKDIDKSKFKIHKMSHIVNNAINEFAFGSRSEKGKVSINIERDFYFKGDENMFVFVIFNLLKNALYYLKTYPDSIITLSTKKEDKSDKEFNYFYFRDTGAGIASDKLESIFESFMTSGKAGGTGLGLPFCKRVVTAFGGKIICNSELEEYTEFVISLPKISDEDRKNKDLYVKEVEELDFKEAIKQKYSNKTILLVDDQLVNRRISSSRLEKLGFNAIMAQHGKEALNILDKRGAEIDIIFMDLQMPEINGYETTKLIQLGQKNKAGHKFQNCQNHKNIIIIAFTGDDDEVTLQRIEDYNMRGRLGKSWSDQELFNVLNKIL